VVVETYAGLAASVLARPARLGRTRLVAVDGPSGAGKSVFAERLAAALTGPLGGPPPVVHTDDLLDGWADQFAFWPRLDRWVLAPMRAGRAGGYHRYDWSRRRFGAARVPVPVAPVLILEGVSTARASARRELTWSVFVTAPARVRLARALARDGADLLPRLRRWRRAERAHFATDRTTAWVDLLVAGVPPPGHDPTGAYLRLRGPHHAQRSR
jgi:hypothetical protein